MVFFWILLYGSVYSLSGSLAPGLTPPAMAVYLALLILWIFLSGQADKIGLTVPRCRKENRIAFLPLALAPLCNLTLSSSAPPALTAILLTLCTCTVEELFFRGFLLSFLEQQQGCRCVFLSAFLFSLFHFANLFSGIQPGYVLLQMLLALAAGLYYGMVRLFCGSLIPCILAHILTNLTAGDLIRFCFPRDILPCVLCICLTLGACLLLYPKLSANYGG